MSLLRLLSGCCCCPVNCHYAAINGAEWQFTVAPAFATPRSIELGEYFKSISDIPAPLRRWEGALSVPLIARRSPTVAGVRHFLAVN